jgi:hypothetical protein
MLFEAHGFGAVELPILSSGEVEARGFSSRLPAIDLQLPRIATPNFSTPRSACVQSGFIARANHHVQGLVGVLEPKPPDPADSTSSSPRRGSLRQARRDRSSIGYSSRVLGTNEEHANEFNDALGEVFSLLNTRSNGVDEGGTGMWNEVEAPRIRLASEKPKAAKAADASSMTKKKKPAKSAGHFVSQRESLSILERLAAPSQPETVAAERVDVAREVADKVERLRSDPREMDLFEVRVAELLREQKRRQLESGPTDYPRVNTTTEKLEQFSPRSMATRLAERSALLAQRVADAQARAHDQAEQRQRQAEQALLRCARASARCPDPPAFPTCR